MKKSLLLGGVFATLAALLLAPIAQAGVDDDTVGARVFNDTTSKISYWQKGLGNSTAVPDNPNSQAYIADTLTHNTGTGQGYDYPKLVMDSLYGLPFYTAKANGSNSTSKTVLIRDNYLDPTTNTCNPLDLSSSCQITINMPTGADPNDGSDSILVVDDKIKGFVYGLWHSWRGDGISTGTLNQWYAQEFDRYQTDSANNINADAGSGLHWKWQWAYTISNGWTTRSAPFTPFNNTVINQKNVGHRGLPGYTRGIRYAEVKNSGNNYATGVGDGTIGHRIEIFWYQTESNIPGGAPGSAYFPMTTAEQNRCKEADNVTLRTGCVPEGSVIRINSDINLEATSGGVNIYGLNKYELVIARTLQKYGAVIGDNSGSGNNIKLQNNVSGGTTSWTNSIPNQGLGVTSDSLSGLLFGPASTSMWEFVPGGWDNRCACTRTPL